MVEVNRKPNESVVIGEYDHRLFRVCVVAINDGIVTLGIDVDPDTVVQRQEVWDRIRGVDNRPKFMNSPLIA